MAKPLAGKRVVITRAREQSAEMATKLIQLGATPILYPMIAFEPLPNATAQVAAALQQSFDWLLLTSQNGVRFFCEIMQGIKAPPPNLPRGGRGQIPLPVGGARGGCFFPTKIGVSGPKTAKKLAAYGYQADLIPDQFVGESLVDALGDVANKQILLPRAKQGRPKIVQMLRERGATVTEIALYETVCPTPSAEMQNGILQGVDVVTFASPSAVRGFASQSLAFSTQPAFACIGPVTGKSAEKHGYPVDIMPKEHTVDSLIAAIATHHQQPTHSTASSALSALSAVDSSHV